MPVYKKLFGGIKTGSGYSEGGKVSLHRDKSFKAGLKKMQMFKYGGLEGKNLSPQDAKKISGVVEPYLRNLPLGGKLSLNNRQKISGQLWKMVKGGEISEEDYKDAKRILKQI